jgi:hypothetical protein
MIKNLKQHHIGCLVHNIEMFKAENHAVWTDDKYSRIYTIASQDVKVCFLQSTEDTRIELVEPGINNQPLSRLLAKGMTYYHIGFISDSYDISVADLLNTNCRQISEFNSEAFKGKRCAFFYHPQLGLIELIEGD